MDTRPLRIGIDMLAWGQSPLADRCAMTEISTLSQLSASAATTHPIQAELTAYTSNQLTFPEEIKTTQASWLYSSRTGRMIYQQFILHAKICSDKQDALFCPYGIMPRYSLIPTVVSVYDTLFLQHPAAVRESEQVRQKRFALLSLQRARRILVPYRLVQDSLIHLCKQKVEGIGDKIRVVPPAASCLYSRQPVEDETASRVRMAYGLPDPYVLACGPFLPRHNPLQIVQGWFAAITNRSLPHRLVILSDPKTIPARIKRMIHELGMDERVFFAEARTEVDRATIFRMASALLMPTTVAEYRQEMVEASACGVPVVAPDVPLDRALCDGGVFYKESLAELRQALETALENRPAPSTAPQTLTDRAAILHAIFRELVEEDGR